MTLEIADVNSTTRRLKTTGDGSEADPFILHTISEDFFIAIGKGLIPGHKILNVPGLHNANVETTALGDLSLIPGVVVLGTPGGVGLEVVGGAQDTAVGDGIRTLDIHYLDVNFNEKNNVVTMDGITPVLTATDIQEIQWIHAQTVGDAGVASGNIEVRGIGAGTVYEYIEAGGNQSLSSRFTIPNGKSGYLINWHCSGLKKRIDFYLRATCDRNTRELLPGVFVFQDTESCESSNSGLLDGKGLRFPAQCTIKLSAKAAITGGEAAGAFALLIVDDEI